MLEFNECTHEYKYNGEVVPSVTQILRFACVDFSSGANPYMRKIAADRGTRIHQACVAYDMDGFDGITEEDADIVPYIKAYKSFLDDYQIKGWELYEKPLYCYAGEWAGTIDRYGFIDGKPTVLDIKTGSKLHMPIHSAQLWAYAYMLRDNGYPVDNATVLHLRKDGTYRTVIADLSEVSEIIFKSCRNLQRYTKG